VRGRYVFDTYYPLLPLKVPRVSGRLPINSKHPVVIVVVHWLLDPNHDSFSPTELRGSRRSAVPSTVIINLG